MDNAAPNPQPNAGGSSPRPSGRTIMRKRFEDDSAPATAAAAAPPPEPERNPFKGRRLGDILVAMGVIDASQFQELEAEARMTKEFLGQILLRRALVQPQQLCEALAIQSGLPMVDLTGYQIPPWTRQRIPLDTMVKYEFVPFADDERAVFIATKRPLNPLRLAELEKLVGRPIDMRLAPDHQIAAMLNAMAPKRVQQKRQHERLAMAIPVWLQVCDERGDNVSASLANTQTVDLSEAGFRIEVPEKVYTSLATTKRRDTHFRVRLSLPPHNVSCVCVLRYMKRKENAKSWEMPWTLGLQINMITAADRESLKQICTRVAIMITRSRLLEE